MLMDSTKSPLWRQVIWKYCNRINVPNQTRHSCHKWMWHKWRYT